jgi:acetyl esterase/lipase
MTTRIGSFRTLALTLCCASFVYLPIAAVASPDTPKLDAAPFLGDHYPVRRLTFPAGVTGFADVTYEILPGFRPLTLDVYVTPPTKPASAHPLVLYIHGGGWTTGHSRQSGAFDNWPKVLASLAARGYTVASLNYRLSSEAPFPAAIQDVKAAIRFLRAHATEYSVDVNKAIVWGGSAGGHLAALAATSCGVKELEPVAPNPALPGSDAIEKQSDCVQGAVTWYGIFDMNALRGTHDSGDTFPPTIARFLNCNGGVCAPETLQLASPQHFVKSDTPPFLLVHGALDKTVDPTQSVHFQETMKAAGASVDLVMIPGVDHSFIGTTLESTRAASLQALNRTFEFIDATVKAPGH